MIVTCDHEHCTFEIDTEALDVTISGRAYVAAFADETSQGVAAGLVLSQHGIREHGSHVKAKLGPSLAIDFGRPT